MRTAAFAALFFGFMASLYGQQARQDLAPAPFNPTLFASAPVNPTMPATAALVPAVVVPTKIVPSKIPPSQINDPDYSKPAGGVFYRWSVVAVGAANAADALSSWGMQEGNPLLGKTFSAQSAAIKMGFIGASFVVERVALHHNPRLYKTFAWMNTAIAGGLGAAAAHNMKLR